MNQIKKYFALAKRVALSSKYKEDIRRYKIGAVAIRKDGVLVTSRNIVTRTPNRFAHAECRLARKITPGSVVFIARVTAGGMYALARPCKNCRLILYLKGVKKIFYTISNEEYGVIEF